MSPSNAEESTSLSTSVCASEGGIVVKRPSVETASISESEVSPLKDSDMTDWSASSLSAVSSVSTCLGKEGEIAV